MRSQLGTIEDLGDGRFRVWVSAGYDPKTGKRVRDSAVVRGTRTDAKAALGALLMRAGRGSADDVTLTTFLEDVWLPTKDHRRQRTTTNYQSKIRTCITPYIGHLALASVTPYVVDRWLSDMARDGKSPQTVKHARAILKNGMRSAVRWRLIEHDPTEGTQIPRIDYEPVVLTAEQMNAYLDTFRGHVIEPVVILCIAVGLRRSEACALDWSDIDFDAMSVSVSRGVHQEGRKVWMEEPKSATSRRIVGLPEWAIESLRPLRGAGPLVADSGHRMAPAKVARLYRKHVEDAKLPYVPMRDLRNSLGTWLYDSGVELGKIADQFGHSDTTITRKHYVVRSHRQADRSTAAVVETLRVCQRVPMDSSEHGQNTTDFVAQGGDMSADAR